MLSHVVSHNTQTQLQWDTSGQPSPKNVLYSEHATCAFPRVPSNMETRAYPKASPNNVFSTCNVRSTKAPSKHAHALKRAGGQGWKGNVFDIATRPAFSTYSHATASTRWWPARSCLRAPYHSSRSRLRRFPDSRSCGSTHPSQRGNRHTLTHAPATPATPATQPPPPAAPR